MSLLTCLVLCLLATSPCYSFPSALPTLSRSMTSGKVLNRSTVMNFSSSNNDEEEVTKNSNLSQQLRRSFLISTALAGVTNLGLAFAAPPNFKRIPTQYIAALGDPSSSYGSNVSEWGIWKDDPGPKGVFLRDYEKYIKARNSVAPAGWKFDQNDWWLEEHGLIMEAPEFPLASGKYLVTGGRLVTTVLEVDDKGNWKLENGSLFDVTHLPCRSARYTPSSAEGGKQGSPLTAKQSDFPVKPGAEMPKVDGCDKLDYAVIFVIGKEAV
jgi:hypothetical protein